MCRVSLLILVSILPVCLPCGLYAQDEDPEVKHLLSLVESSRTELRRGEFNGRGIRYDDPKGQANSPVSFKCAFDEEQGRFRFDTDGRTMISISASTLPDRSKPELARADYSKHLNRHRTISRILRTSEYATEWFAFGNSVDDREHATIFLELRERSAVLTGLGSVMFRPEVAGLMEPSSVGNFQTFSEVMDSYRTRASKVTLAPSGEKMVVILDSHGKVQRRITIDVQAGHTITGMELVELDSNGKALDFPKKTSSATWKKHESVWVPSSIQTRYLHEDGSIFGVDLLLNWTSVNSNLPVDQLFEYEHLDGVWDGVQVVDRRGFSRRILGSFKDGEFEADRISDSPAESAQ